MKTIDGFIDNDGDKHDIRLPDREEELKFEYPYVYEAIKVSHRNDNITLKNISIADSRTVYDLILDNRKFIHEDSKSIVFFKCDESHKLRLLNAKNARIVFRIPGGFISSLSTLFQNPTRFGDLIGVECLKDSEFILSSYDVSRFMSTSFVKYTTQDDFRLLASPTGIPQHIESIDG